MKTKDIILIVCSVFMLCGCYSLKAPVVEGSFPVGQYKYAYISPTSGLTSSAGGVYGGQYGVYGATATKSVNPGDVIAGALIKQGLVILPEVKPELADETLIVNYGESGRRGVFMGYNRSDHTVSFSKNDGKGLLLHCRGHRRN